MLFVSKTMASRSRLSSEMPNTENLTPLPPRQQYAYQKCTESKMVLERYDT